MLSKRQWEKLKSNVLYLTPLVLANSQWVLLIIIGIGHTDRQRIQLLQAQIASQPL
jgi:hypothetical protein